MDEQVKRGPGRPKKIQVDLVQPEQQPVEKGDAPMAKVPEQKKGRDFGADLPEQHVIEPNIAPPPTVGVASAQRSDVSRERLEDERFIRVRVRRVGGFIKDLDEKDKAAATAVLAKWKRSVSDGWDMSIHIQGFDNASHATNQERLFRRPVEMITMGHKA